MIWFELVFLGLSLLGVLIGIIQSLFEEKDPRFEGARMWYRS